MRNRTRRERLLARQERVLVEQRRLATLQMVQQETYSQTTYKGPLPPPQMLAQFDALRPGFADRIVQMAEQAQSHQIAMEATIVYGQADGERRGQWMGFFVWIAILATSVYLIERGITVWGVLGILGVLTSAAVRVTYGFFQRFRKTSDETEKTNTSQLPLPLSKT